MPISPFGTPEERSAFFLVFGVAEYYMPINAIKHNTAVIIAKIATTLVSGHPLNSKWW